MLRGTTENGHATLQRICWGVHAGWCKCPVQVLLPKLKALATGHGGIWLSIRACYEYDVIDQNCNLIGYRAKPRWRAPA
jgi:hypothetical protein